MKKIVQLLIIPILFFSCTKENPEETKYKKMYPFFEKVSINSESGTVSLNNFKDGKNGVEYLLRRDGSLLEYRTWNNNKLNGKVLLFVYNKKPIAFAQYKDDIVDGDYFVFDTITGKVDEYRETLNINGQSSDNQIIVFKQGEIDYSKSRFIIVTKLDNQTYRIGLCAAYKNPLIRLYTVEKNDSEYDYKIQDTGEITDGINDDYCLYKVKDKSKKYVIGCLLNYRLPEPEEVKNGTSKDELIGQITYFKIKI